MSNVLTTAHVQWANRPSDQRFKTLDALYERVSSRRNISRTSDVPLIDIEANVSPLENNKETIIFNHGVKAVEPSHWSLTQFCGLIGAPVSYIRQLPPELAVRNLNHGIQKNGKEVGERKFMTLLEEDGGLNTLQAVTSTTYGRIWDADVVSAVMKLNDATGNKFYNPPAYADGNFGALQTEPAGLYASDRDVFIFMIDGGSVLDVGPRANINRGFIVSNSEVGSKTFSLTTFLFNTVCCNHLIWGVKEIRELSIRHTKNGPSRFIQEATPALLEYVNSSAKTEESAIRKAMDFMIPSSVNGQPPKRDEIVQWVSKLGKFSKGEIGEAIDSALKEEGDCRTLWQMIQGFTASARSIEWVDARIDLETRAGNLLKLVAE